MKCPSIGDLDLGVNIFYLHLWVNIDLVNQRIKCLSVGAGYVSRRRTSAFDDHLDDRFVVFKYVKQRIVAIKFQCLE